MHLFLILKLLTDFKNKNRIIIKKLKLMSDNNSVLLEIHLHIIYYCYDKQILYKTPDGKSDSDNRLKISIVES